MKRDQYLWFAISVDESAVGVSPDHKYVEEEKKSLFVVNICLWLHCVEI